MKKRRIGVVLVSLAVLFLTACQKKVPEGGDHYEVTTDGSLVKELIYTTEEKEEERTDGLYERIEVAGKTYQLMDIEYEVTGQEIKEEESIRIVESGPILEGEAYQPEETLEVDGITYRLIGIQEKENGLVSTPYEQPVRAYDDYDYYVTSRSVPATKTVTVTNYQTGMEEEVLLSLEGVSRLPEGTWMDSHIDITYVSYDSQTFRFGDTYVSKEDAPQLNEHQLLASVGADTETCRVRSIYWTGGAYLDASGVLSRDARADVERYVYTYRATYKGTIREEARTGTVYELTYSGKKPVEGQYLYEITATASYQESQTVYYVMAGITFLTLALLAAGLLFLVSRRKKENGTRLTER